jgi:prepilin-type N-terminal cleavage/methylation domain-containing protein
MLTRLRQQDGMSLPELLVALVIASIVSLAAFGLVDTVMKRYGETAARVDTTERSRIAMDQITRELRSQVCVTRSDGTAMTSARSIYSATPTSITFFADTADESWTAATTSMPVPTLRTLSLNGSMLSETIVQGRNDTVNLGAVTFGYAGAGNKPNTLVRQLLGNIGPLSEKVGTVIQPIPFFRYYAYTTTAPATPTRLLTPDPSTGALSLTDLQSIARIQVSFVVSPTSATIKRGTTAMQNDVFVRTVDPNATNPLPTCL